jgi:hypothetical protein
MTGLFILIGILVGLKIVLDQWVFDKQRAGRRTYYRDTYLSSDDWKRKRSLVLKRDRYRCVFCGGRAMQVHHKQYARRKHRQRATRVARLSVQVVSREAAWARIDMAHQRLTNRWSQPLAAAKSTFDFMKHIVDVIRQLPDSPPPAVAQLRLVRTTL